MSILTEVTVQIINTWLSKDVLDEDINDVFQEKGFMNYSNSPVINEVFYEETTLQTGQTQELDLASLSQFILSEFVAKSFSYVHTITIKNSDPTGVLQFDVTGAGYAGTFLGNPTGLIPIGPNGAIHFTSISGLETTDGQIALRNNGTVPVTYQMFVGGNI